MSARYDPSIIQEFADGLYSRAESIARNEAGKYAFLFCVVFLAVGFGVGKLAADPNLAFFLGAGFAVVGCLMGYRHGLIAGRQKAFELKLEAQRILVLSEIAEHIRKG